ncbi:MAG TPA: type II secretion system F family protein [Aestuariivirgaceae bacterium]|jgi:tight adherence protein B
MVSGEMGQLILIGIIALSVGGVALVFLYPYLAADAKTSRRIESISDKSKLAPKLSFRQRFLKDDPKDTRRRQLQESLKQLEEEERKRKKKVTLRVMLAQAGLETSPRSFWMMSLIFGALIAGAAYIFGLPWYAAGAAFLAAGVGFPRWCLNFLRRRRQQVFLADFADAIDIVVRGLKSGLPVSDALKVIASEVPPPVGPEFLEVVEGQRVGITIDQGIERMYERMPLAEVNFLAIVMAIQAKTGGNLAEALNNLSKVLRDRKKMKAKIRSVSQEAKSSAMIIGSLPFCIIGLLSIFSPDYLTPLWSTRVGNIMLVGCVVWMTLGSLVMRKMINFEY